MLHGVLIFLFFSLIGAFSILLCFNVISKMLMAARQREISKNEMSIMAEIETFITGSDGEFMKGLEDFFGNAVNRDKNFLIALDNYLLSALENPRVKDRDRYIAIAKRFNYPADALVQIRSGNIRSIALGSRRAGLYNCREAAEDMIAVLDILSSENQFEILMGLARIGSMNDMQRAFMKIKNNILVNERAIIAILGAFPEGEDKKILFRCMIRSDTDYVTALFLKAMDREMARELQDDIITVFRNGKNEIRVSAIRGISALGDEAPADILIQALEDNDWEIRALAAKALGQIITPESSAALYKALFDQQWWIRQNAANALINHPGYEQLFILAAESGDEYTKDSIISVLENGNDPVLLRSIKRMVA